MSEEMTDKQIIIDKDKFEKAENEPINQEAVNKFIEETDKFYVDGVDVSGCAQFIQDEKDCCGLGGRCKGWTTCYYKIWKRKEQECERLREKCKKYGEINEQKTKDYAELKAENERLEAHSATLDAVIETGRVQYKALKQTLAEIKEIANKTLWTYPNLDDVTKYNMFDKILQKINEVENAL